MDEDAIHRCRGEREIVPFGRGAVFLTGISDEGSCVFGDDVVEAGIPNVFASKSGMRAPVLEGATGEDAPKS
jgi:hypothetical protein